MNPMSKPSLDGGNQSLDLFQQVGRAVPSPIFEYLMRDFDPDKTWLELMSQQRLSAQGYIFTDQGASKVKPGDTLPRQIAQAGFGMSVGICEINRDGAGKLVISKYIRGCEQLRHVVNTDLFQRLKLTTPSQYFFAYFDTRLGRETLLAAWCEKVIRWLQLPRACIEAESESGVVYWQNIVKKSRRFGVCFHHETCKPIETWEPTESSTDIRPMQGEVHVIPSFDPAFAIYLIPARHNLLTIRRAFYTQLKSAKFKEWHRRCVEYWKTLTCEMTRFPKNPDGIKRIERDGTGQLVREKFVRPKFEPKVHLPPKAKPGKSAKRVDLWLGLAANDLVGGGIPFGKSSVEGRFLREQAESWETLRNHQRSAATRLKELETRYGRLDKKLAYRIKETVERALDSFF